MRTCESKRKETSENSVGQAFLLVQNVKNNTKMYKQECLSYYVNNFPDVSES